MADLKMKVDDAAVWCVHVIFAIFKNRKKHNTCRITFGAAILLHGRISKIRLRHGPRTDAGYNYGRGQWVPIGDVRPASGGQKGGSHHPARPRITVTVAVS